MEIAFHCPNCLADLIYDESKSYTWSSPLSQETSTENGQSQELHAWVLFSLVSPCSYYLQVGSDFSKEPGF